MPGRTRDSIAASPVRRQGYERAVRLPAVDLDPLGHGVKQPVFLHPGRRVVAQLDAAVARYAVRRQDLHDEVRRPLDAGGQHAIQMLGPHERNVGHETL